MKAQREESTAPGVCQLLRRSRLLTPGEVDALEQRWQREAANQADVQEFARWLVAGRYVTEYQTTMLLRGRVEHFFLGEYKLLEKIGRERRARVYRAVNRIGFVAAVKVLPPSQARDAEGLARFRREARLGRLLDHANVMRVLDDGEDDGVHYLVMEYLEGETLQDLLARRGRLPVAEAVDVAVQALAGLEHLRERGLVHRCLEPASLLLVHSPQQRRAGESPPLVKIQDLSLCRTAEAVADGGLSRRIDEELLRATAYPAPELARDPHTSDIRGDVFSLGCVLYHALAGPPRFVGGGSGPHAIVAPVGEVNPEVPEELALLVGRMMAADPAERFPTPREAADALQAFLTRSAPAIVEMEPVAWPPPPMAPPASPGPFEDFGPAEEFSDLSDPFASIAAAPLPLPDPALAFTDAGPGVPGDLVVLAPSQGRRPRRVFLGNGREWLLLLLGAGSLLLVEGLAWLLGRLLRNE